MTRIALDGNERRRSRLLLSGGTGSGVGSDTWDGGSASTVGSDTWDGGSASTVGSDTWDGGEA